MRQAGILIVLLFGFLTVKGQSPFHVGVKFGTQYSSLIYRFDQVFDESQVSNYHAGAFARVSLGRVYLQPEAYFNTKGGIIDEFNYLSIDDPGYFEDFRYQTVDIPILLGYHLVHQANFNIRFYGGPVLSYITVEPLIRNVSDLSIDDLKDNYIGLQLGVGFDVWFVTIDARMESAFNIFIEGSQYSAANRVFLLSAGIKLF
ncbi:MAG TPA: outer membrane beta-barrel protein [Prolixibacteraceae bacterium]|nr:outer membrane beta-barrel protein [Prolixibacteraceae bacterium]